MSGWTAERRAELQRIPEMRAALEEIDRLNARWEALKASAKAGDAYGFKAWTVVGDEITRLEREPPLARLERPHD